jgi:uracil-DNA glycosylase family 4
MSFFFVKKDKERKFKRNTTANFKSTNAKQNAAVLNRLGCQACPLNKAPISTPKMAPTLAHGAQIYFLAEAPGRDEDERSHKPLTGPSGRLLRSCIPDGAEHICSFDNVVNCRPPDNRTPIFTEIECCRPRRIKWIEQNKPKLIVGLGAVPMQAIIGTADMAGLRGRLFAVKIGNHKCWFLPTYHPSFIMRIAYDKDKPLQSRLGHCFRMDIQKAFKLVNKLGPPEIVDEADVRSNLHTFDGHGDEHFPIVLDLLEEAIKAPAKAIDLETRFLRPYTAGAAIMSVALSFGGTNFAFALDHPKSGWAPDEKARLKKTLFRLLEDDTKKVAHNAPFELEWLIWYLGPKVVNHTSWECTMMQAHFLDERKGKYREDYSKANRYQGLDFLINQHFGIKYKHLFKVDKRDLTKSDLSEILIYNAADTKLTLKLYHRQQRLIVAEGLMDAYLESVIKDPTVALMQHLGVPVSQKAVRAAQRKLRPKLFRYKTQLYRLKVVKQFKKDNKEFNWQSNKDVVKIFRDYLKSSEIFIHEKSYEVNDFNKPAEGKRKTRDEGGPKARISVDKAVLSQINHPLPRLLLKLRGVAKIKSTYVDVMRKGSAKAVVFPDGCLHTSFNTTATETGRLSSDEPNLQNYPKRKDAWVRNQVEAEKDEVVVAVDYGQLEACTGAMCSRDRYLTKALWNDYDIHMEWAQKFAHDEPGLIGGRKYLKDPVAMKNFRSLIKNKMVFPAFFGAANESVHGYLVNATGFDLSQKIVDRRMDEFWSTFSGMASWQKKTMSRYYDEGYVATMQGRKHHYPLSKNQAINMPVQGTAAELVCDAMNRLSYISLKTNQPHIHPRLNVHDDLTFFIPDDDRVLEDSLKIIMREMLCFPFKWINVPLSVEVSIGKNWADVAPIGKFWSHREYGYPRNEYVG